MVKEKSPIAPSLRPRAYTGFLGLWKSGVPGVFQVFRGWISTEFQVILCEQNTESDQKIGEYFENM